MPSKEIWIQNGLVVTQNSKREVIRAHIQVLDGRITAITPKTPSSLKRRRHKKIDAKGKVILPGFVQPHVHLCQTLFRNLADDLELLDWLTKKIWVFEAAHTARSLYLSSILGIYELLSSGTTCILDMATVRHTPSVFKAVGDSGIRASVGKCLMDHPETTPDGLRESTSDALAEAEALFHKHHDTHGGRLRVSFAPRFVVSCTEELLKGVRNLALELGTLIHTHASENLKEIELVEKLTGKPNVEYLHELDMTCSKLVLAHCIHLNPREMDILAKTNTQVAHCPSSNLKLASGVARVPEMLQRGINVGIAADGAPCNNNLNQFQEMRLAALIQKPEHGPTAMRAQEVLDMATRGGARALDWFDEIGSLEVGKKADLFALELDHPENLCELEPESVVSSVVYASQPAHVAWTMVDGRMVYERGRKFLGEDPRAWARKGLLARRKLLIGKSGLKT